MNFKWKTKAGQAIKIKDMTSVHIQNCMRLLERNKCNEDMQVGAWASSMSGDMASYCAEQDFDNALEESVEERFPIYKAFECELKKRAATGGQPKEGE